MKEIDPKLKFKYCLSNVVSSQRSRELIHKAKFMNKLEHLVFIYQADLLIHKVYEWLMSETENKFKHSVKDQRERTV